MYIPNLLFKYCEIESHHDYHHLTICYSFWNVRGNTLQYRMTNLQNKIQIQHYENYIYGYDVKLFKIYNYKFIY